MQEMGKSWLKMQRKARENPIIPELLQRFL